MKGYKAFEPGMICKGKQYAENTVFEEDSAVVCESGMHFCKNPFNVLDHYALVSGSGEIPDFAEVEALEKPNTDNGRKYCTRKLKVDAKLNLAGFVKACVEYIDRRRVLRGKLTRYINAAAMHSGERQRRCLAWRRRAMELPFLERHSNSKDSIEIEQQKKQRICTDSQ